MTILSLRGISAASPSTRARHRRARFGALLVAVAAGCAPGLAFAGFSCTGPVTYLGVDGGGDLTIQLGGSTPIHKICNVNVQGSFTGFSVASCKIAYAAALSAHMTGKTLTTFYSDSLTCATIVSWAEEPNTYFVAGPD